MRSSLLAAALTTFVAIPAFAQVTQTKPDLSGVQSSVTTTENTQLDAVTVEGLQPGPGLWQVTKGNNTVWIMATVAPMPANMQWESSTAKTLLAQAQHVIYPPGLFINMKVGFFKGLMLAGAMRNYNKNPDGQTLQQVVSSPVYARWTALKQRFIPGNKDVEKMRPIFASDELTDGAFKYYKLTGSNFVAREVREVVKARNLSYTNTVVRVDIDDPGAALKEFSKTKLNDEACLSDDMSLLENNIPAVRARANAWARGDVKRLRMLPITDTGSNCVMAVMEAEVANKRGINNLPARFRENWLNAVDNALSKYETTFAYVPFEKLVGNNGLLEALRAKGYEITEP